MQDSTEKRECLQGIMKHWVFRYCTSSSRANVLAFSFMTSKEERAFANVQQRIKMERRDESFWFGYCPKHKNRRLTIWLARSTAICFNALLSSMHKVGRIVVELSFWENIPIAWRTETAFFPRHVRLIKIWTTSRRQFWWNWKRLLFKRESINQSINAKRESVFSPIFHFQCFSLSIGGKFDKAKGILRYRVILKEHWCHLIIPILLYR